MLILSVHLAHVFDRWTLTAPKVSRPLQLVLSGGPVTPTPIREYNGLKGENRGPFKGQQASASNPAMWLWLAGLYVRKALPHMLPANGPKDYSLWASLPPDTQRPADRLYPGVTAQLRNPCTQAGGRVATADWPVGHWTRVQGSPTVDSTVTRTLVKYNLHASGWNTQRSFTQTSKFAFITYWSNW